VGRILDLAQPFPLPEGSEPSEVEFFRPAREHPWDSGGGAKATTHGNLVGNSGVHLLRKVRLRT